MIKTILKLLSTLLMLTTFIARIIRQEQEVDMNRYITFM